MSNPTYKTYQFDVPERGALISPDFDLDKNVVNITGIALDSTKRGVLFNYGTQRLEMGGQEIFPEGHRSNMLMFGLTASDKLHRFKTALAPGTGKMRIIFKDTWQAPASGQPDDWQPYRVFVTIEQTANR